MKITKLRLHALLALAGLSLATAQDAGNSATAEATSSAADADDDVVVVANVTEADTSDRTSLTSLVRVNVTRQRYNLLRPWEKVSPDSRNGLGAMIAGGKILVSAETVANSSYIEIEKPVSGEKATADVVAVDYEANLALLQPSKGHEEFLKDFVPLDLDTSVKIGDELTVWQIESNGTPFNTSMKVSKAETGGYFLPNYYFLRFEALGSLQYRGGSFTLPVVKGDKIAGLLLSYSTKTQTSNILPSSIIAHFLKDQADGKYEGFPTLGISFSRTLDDQFRAYLNLGADDGGIFVSKVEEGSSAGKGGVKEGDVILEVSGKKIDSRGNYDHAVFGKLSMSHLVRGEPFVGEEIIFKVMRGGEKLDLTIPLTRREPTEYLIEPYLFDRGPKFMILGGMIFTELSVPYMELYGDKWRSRAPIKFLQALAQPEEFEEKGLKKIVILSRVLPTPATLGYEEVNSVILTKVNGKPIQKITDLAEAVKSPVDGIHSLEFDEFPKLIFLDAQITAAIDQQLEQRLGTIKRLD
jgi:S1-C subfamily serine protease